MRSKLSEVIEIISGGTPKTSVKEYWKDGDIYWLSVNDFNNDSHYVYKSEKKITQKGVDESNTKFLQKDDVIISARGTVGALAQIYSPMCFNQSCFGLRGKEGILDSTYLYYYLKNYVSHIRKRTHGSVFETINIKSFDLIDIDYPEKILEQKSIIDILRLIDDKIELNNRINAELESMVKTIYEYWFVQFDFPDENGRPYKSSGGKMFWSEKLKKEIPAGWVVENLKNNCLTTLIKPGIDIFEGEKTYLATADVVNNQINFGADKVTFENRESRANMKPIPNSVWFAKMKNSKKSLYFGEYSDYFLKSFILSTGFAGLVCRKNFYLEYIWGIINNDHFETVKDRLANGATQEAINNDSMTFLPMIIPIDNILLEYHRKTFEMYKKIYLNQITNHKLAELRDWLLPMLMNGQVKVKS